MHSVPSKLTCLPSPIFESGYRAFGLPVVCGRAVIGSQPGTTNRSDGYY